MKIGDTTEMSAPANKTETLFFAEKLMTIRFWRIILLDQFQGTNRRKRQWDGYVDDKSLDSVWFFYLKMKAS